MACWLMFRRIYMLRKRNSVNSNYDFPNCEDIFDGLKKVPKRATVTTTDEIVIDW